MANEARCPECDAPIAPADTTCSQCGTTLGQEESDEGMPEAQAAMSAAAAAERASAARPTGRRPAHGRSATSAVVPFISALVLTILLQVLVSSTIETGTYLHRLFRPPGTWVMSLVPGMIAFLFFWTIVDLVQKYLAGRANETDMERREIRQLPRLVAHEPTGVLQRRLLALAGPDRPVARRLLWLLHYLESHADAQRTHDLLRHQADLDADTAAAGYRTVKLFIWAMPILGFVGTVLGISLAVGGFSTFLTTNLDIEDVSLVTAELGNVASGLSFAFDTTLLGLLGGLIANVMSSIVQKRDEHFFTRLDELGLSIVANRQDAPAASRETQPLGDAGAAFEQVMRARLHELTEQIARTQEIMHGLGETSSKMNVALSESISSVRRTVQEMGTNLEGVSEALAGSMHEVGERVTAAHGRFQDGLDGLRNALERTLQQGAESAESQASVERAVRQLSSSINDFGEMLSEFRTEQNALAPVLAQLAGPLDLKLVPSRPRSE